MRLHRYRNHSLWKEKSLIPCAHLEVELEHDLNVRAVCEAENCTSHIHSAAHCSQTYIDSSESWLLVSVYSTIAVNLGLLNLDV